MITLSLLLWQAVFPCSLYLYLSLPVFLCQSLSLSLFHSNNSNTREWHNECGTFSTSLSEWPVKAAPQQVRDETEDKDEEEKGKGEYGSCRCSGSPSTTLRARHAYQILRRQRRRRRR